MYISIVKPLFDFCIALLLLIALSPLLLIITFLLAITQNGDIFFTQIRPGCKEKHFRLIKFKTMTNAKDASGHLLPDMDRMHSIGKFLRKTSLDELPQLFNVMSGKMSFVGPRPLLIEYLPLYSSDQRRRHLVKPGITGWAQVNGRNAISWTEKFALDCWYVDHLSFKVDLKILFLTILKVTAGTDVNASEAVTMEKFKGNN